MITLEIVEGCNFKCWFCDAKNVQRMNYMDLDFFKRIILEAKELGVTIVDMIPTKGEPFLHPNIYEMIEFANEHMKKVLIITNLTAVNIEKLKTINMKNTRFTVSYYGSTKEKFKELTLTNNKLFDIFHRKLKELQSSNIKHTIGYRDREWIFDSGDLKPYPPFTKNSGKCIHHQRPRIFPNGNITFCKYVTDISNDEEIVNYANLNNTSLKEALEHPLRYKFFESQSICYSNCIVLPETCSIEPPISSYKLMAASKKNYELNSTEIDKKYMIIEKAATQQNLVKK
jgi:hypothetical protein